MRMTYDLMFSQYLTNIGKAPTTLDTNIISSFQNNLSQRYQLVLAKMANYVTQQDQSTLTVSNQQYYHYPPGIVSIDAVSVTIGSISYPLDPIYGQHAWDWINSIQIQPTVIPKFIFPRRDDFGIYPTPQADDYIINFKSFMRFINMTIADYTIGTISVTQAGQTITVAGGGTFTPAMVGRWFVVTDPTAPGQGFWYRIAAWQSSSALTLESAYQGDTGSGLTYRIGQSPEIPEEGHIILVDGVTSDFYANNRDDQATAQQFENKFWTGDRFNTSRAVGDDDKVSAGLIGLMNRYNSRTKKHLIVSDPYSNLYQNFLWGQTIT